MTHFVDIESIKDALAECPICTEYFNDTPRIPRRLPCCLQAVCEPCLEIYSRGCLTMSCPLCRHQHNLPGGVKSLPIEMVILRFLDVLKTKSNVLPPCTDCPDNNTAMARCDTCSSYLCQPCLNAHSRNRVTKDHMMATFEEIKSRRSMRSGITGTQMNSESSAKLNTKIESVKQRIGAITLMGQILEQSKKSAVDQINVYFDDLIEELQQRRGTLLLQAESKAEREQKSIMRVIESHKTLLEKLQKISKGPVTPSALKALLEQSPEDILYNRRGVSFMEDNKEQAMSIIRASSLVRMITFSETDIPDLDGSMSVSITLEDVQTPQDFLSNRLLQLPNGVLFCPDIRFDPSISSGDITISGSVVKNCKPESIPAKTGCRMKSRRVLFSKLDTHLRYKRYLYSVKIRFKLKQALLPGYMIWEVASNHSHLDRNSSQNDGVLINISTCREHHEHRNHMCLRIERERIIHFCKPVVQNRGGATRALQIVVVTDSEKKVMQIIDVAGVSALATVSLALGEPMVTSMYIGREINSELEVELVSGQNISLSEEVMEVLNAL